MSHAASEGFLLSWQGSGFPIAPTPGLSSWYYVQPGVYYSQDAIVCSCVDTKHHDLAWYNTVFQKRKKNQNQKHKHFALSSQVSLQGHAAPLGTQALKFSNGKGRSNLMSTWISQGIFMLLIFTLL